IQFVDVFPNTPDRKVHLFSDQLDESAPLGLYGFQPDPATDGFPLTLISPAIRPGTVSLPKGLWRRSTRNGYTATALAPDTLTDIGGGACFNDARVQVASLATA